jgi:hypothetical protein
LIIVYSTPDTELGHEALIEYQAKQPLLDRLGNIITDPLGILEAVSCPGILTYDAFCHWYSLTDVTVAKRSVHFENAAYFWGEALWDVSCRDEALFAAASPAHLDKPDQRKHSRFHSRPCYDGCTTLRPRFGSSSHGSSAEALALCSVRRE